MYTAKPNSKIIIEGRNKLTTVLKNTKYQILIYSFIGCKSIGRSNNVSGVSRVKG